MSDEKGDAQAVLEPCFYAGFSKDNSGFEQEGCVFQPFTSVPCKFMEHETIVFTKISR
jgi:hypothetical protein